jgi:ligand-binding SRPBCC domain-containing protein
LRDSKSRPYFVVKIHSYNSELWLPRSVDEVFAFFSDAYNLQAITPDWLNFEILTPRPIAMHAGALIDYKLRVRGIPLKWRTKITQWQPPHRFVDEQIRGPYRQWIHEHRFEPKDGGTLCKDHVRYAVLGGELVNRLFVRRDVEGIFDYRKAKLVEQFS